MKQSTKQSRAYWRSFGAKKGADIGWLDDMDRPRLEGLIKEFRANAKRPPTKALSPADAAVYWGAMADGFEKYHAKKWGN